jgi:hypothetical protein
MAKELPYFQFEPAEYLTKDISFCSLQAQGLFINICAFYWQRECNLTKAQVLRRFNYPDVLKELIEEGIIKADENNNIVISFLLTQYEEIIEKKSNDSEKGKIGNLKRWHKSVYDRFIKKELSLKEALEIAKTSGSDSLAIAKTSQIREEKIKEDEIKIDNKKFVENCLASEQWLETICMQKKITLAKIKILLIEFETHLVLSGDQKKYLEDFKTHFNNWLNKKDLSDNKMKLPKRIVS